ncbi:hypothetical protein KIW84_011419 [Lathyrus oleraceus]|uniref:Uncharacterized protein n=1 Tax=Pisum sativum TaxID=3888 RepID=A0A9D5BEW7_PEA|nr:hypothetical protein KIW84_011419 [Pisum sativum]
MYSSGKNQVGVINQWSQLQARFFTSNSHGSACCGNLESRMNEGAEQQYQCQIETPLINQLPNQGFLLSNIADAFLLELVVAAVTKIEPDDNLQDVVDRFIEGPARIKRSVNLNKGEEATENNESVIYKDVSMERVSFLVQQAMRAFHAQNLGNAKSRLNLCAEDIRS